VIKPLSSQNRPFLQQYVGRSCDEFFVLYHHSTNHTAKVGVGGGKMFTGVKVFSATKAKEREELGDEITRWLRKNPHIRLVDKVVTQSSDREFHCLTITLFYENEDMR
jgi:hypothetical protein